MEAFLFLSSLRRSQALMRLLGHRQTYLFEYFTVQDTMVIHNKDMTVWRKIEHYLGGDQSIRQGQLRPEDSWQIRELLTGSLHGPMELRGIRTQGEETVYEVDAVPSEDEAAGTIYLGYIRDITLEKAKEKSLRQQAQRDSAVRRYPLRVVVDEDVVVLVVVVRVEQPRRGHDADQSFFHGEFLLDASLTL